MLAKYDFVLIVTPYKTSAVQRAPHFRNPRLHLHLHPRHHTSSKMRVSFKGKSRKPTKYKNTSETFEFKAAVLAYYDTHSMPATVAAFWPGIQLRNRAYTTKKRVVLRWRQSRSRIDVLAASAKTAKLKRYRELGSAKTLSDDVELDIFEWLVAVRRNGVPVSATMLKQEAVEIARMYDVPPSAFAASSTWMASYLSRYSLALRAKTRQGQSPPADSATVAQEFSATVRRRIVEEGIVKIYNADQTAVFFEYVPKHTVDERGSKTVWVKCGSKSKERLTAMLMADSTGRKYEPWVILKMRPSTIAETREENTRLRHGFSRKLWPSIQKLQDEHAMPIFTNSKGWWNSELSLRFLEYYFGERDNRDAPVMLLWDDFSAHWTAEVVQYAASKNVVLQRVPPGYTHCCQPADISWNKPLKDRLRASWLQHLKSETARLLASEENKVRAPDRAQVVGWLRAAWEELSASTIKSGYKKVGLLFDERAEEQDESSETVDNELAAILESLSCIDTTVGEVSWDDDVVARYL